MRFSPLPRLVTITLGIFFLLATSAPLPFAIILPGEAQNVFKGVITFKSTENYPATGRIDLMSIRVTNPDSWIFGPEIIYSWISSERSVYPKSAIFPPGTSSKEERKQAKAEMIGSQDKAIFAAVSYLRANPKIMDSDSLSAGEAGSNGKQRANELETKNIDFKVKETGGPSGGLVFAIALVELLTEKDILQGEHIAGTGTINARGIVGGIGGINEKISAAQKVGATLFFAPVSNASEIANVPADIKVITVATLAQAIAYLEDRKKQ
jgi:PDZ domain-containing protein